MNVKQDRLYRERRILKEVRPLGPRRSIYYGHVPPARDRQLFKGCLRAPLRASRGDRNNIPYILFIKASLSIIRLRFIYIIFINSKILISGIYGYLSLVLDLKILFIVAGYTL